MPTAIQVWPAFRSLWHARVTRASGVTPIGDRVPFLLRETLFLGGATGLRLLARLGNDERLTNELDQSLLGGFAILLLTSSGARYDAHEPLGIEPRHQFGEQPSSLLLVHRRRVRKIPQQLDSRR